MGKVFREGGSDGTAAGNDWAEGVLALGIGFFMDFGLALHVRGECTRVNLGVLVGG